MTVAPTTGKATAEAIFSLFNLGCSSCSGIIEGRLKELHGITGVNVNYVTDTVVVDYDPNRLTTDDIRAFMKKVSHDTLGAV
jgi:copper chaperone CopZ